MDERILLVGGGGREHALARSLASHDVALYAFARNENPGIAALADDYRTGTETDVDAVVDYALEHEPTMAVVGPEAPLHEGVTDRLEEAGIFTYGPPQRGAKLETDKEYQREFMREHDIPCLPRLETFEDADAACDYLQSFDSRAVIKPATHAQGKAVRIVGEDVTLEEGEEYIRSNADDKFIVEEYLDGVPFSVWCFVAGDELQPLVMTRDHKRVYEGEEGPNTGGMGTYTVGTTRLPYVSAEHYERALTALRETLDATSEYKGVLCGQFFLTADGVRLIDYNVRFGDAEIINQLVVMETDFLDVIRAARDDGSVPELEFTEDATVCKYAVPPGYPTGIEDGLEVSISEPAGLDTDGDPSSVTDAALFYGRVDGSPTRFRTFNSRSLAVCARADSVPAAAEAVDEAFEGLGDTPLHVRDDIGARELVEEQTAAGRALH